MAKENKLREEVAKKYDIEGTPGIYITKAPGRERIDLRRITIAKADKLYAEGKLPMLRLKKGTGSKES